MKFRKKMTAILLTAISMMILVIPVMAKPQSITVSFNQAQYQWRANAPYGSWTVAGTYQNYATSETYKLTGNVLHTYWTYQPDVDDERGAPTVYTYNNKEDLWIEKEGRVSYIYEPIYGEYRAYNFFRGYLDFDGDPSQSTFIHGVAYQWIYIYAPADDAGVTEILPYAQWDSTVEAWLVGFSIYLWDPDPQTYTTPFPDPMIQPIPANNYNHLDL